MPTVVITGGAGFIGSHLVERFLGEGWTVHIVDNLVTGKRENIAPGDVVTLDFSPARLNVELGEDGRIKLFRCG